MASVPAPVSRKPEAPRTSHLRSEFLARVSHELRGPLQTIMGFTELLSMEIKGPLNEEQQQYLAYIQRDSRHLLSVIDDIADLGGIEAGRLELLLETLDAEPAILESMAAMRPLAEARSITLESALTPGLLLRADRVRFGVILCNLVGNALKFTPERGRIRVESRRVGGCARISVRDTGTGISPADHASIFDSVSLAISRRLVELQAGKIWIETDFGVGNQFHFTIPLANGSL